MAETIKTHWKKLHNPDYLGSYSLEYKQDLTLTIKEVKQEMVMGLNNKKENCTVVYFEEEKKPMVLNVTNSKTIAKIYKTPYIEEWKDKKIQLFSENIKAFGEIVEALRIRPFEPSETIKEKDIKCELCGQVIKTYNNMASTLIAESTKKTYGKNLCWNCAVKTKKENEKEK